MASLEASESIAGERALRYKRNVLAVSFVGFVVVWAGTSLGGVTIFDVSLADSKFADKEAIAWLILFALLLYQWIMLLYYGLTDWRVWRDRLWEKAKLPFRFYFLPLKDQARVKLGKYGEYLARVHRGMDSTLYRMNKVGMGDAGAIRYEFRLTDSDLAIAKRRLLAFFTIEFAGPALIGAICLFVALLHWTPLITVSTPPAS